MAHLRTRFFLFLFLLWPLEFSTRSIHNILENPHLPSDEIIGFTEELDNSIDLGSNQIVASNKMKEENSIDAIDSQSVQIERLEDDENSEFFFSGTFEDTVIEEYYEPLSEKNYFDNIMDTEDFYEPLADTFEEFIEPLDSDKNYEIYSVYEKDDKLKVPEAFVNEGYKPVNLDQESISFPSEGKHFTEEDNHPTSEDSNSKQNCYPVERIVYEEHCVPYKHKTCTQIHQEECYQTTSANCSSVVSPHTETNCEEVVERFCKLKQTNQKNDCPMETISICDQVFEIEENETNSTDCSEIQILSPKEEWQNLEDITCTFSSELVCRYPSLEYCSLQPTHKCYKTPRQVYTRNYKNKNICEHLTARTQKPVLIDECKEEQVHKCSGLDEIYENCIEMKREICLTSTWETLEVKCNHLNIPECKYIPKNHCVEEDKKHCELFERVQTKMVCSQDIDTDRSTVFYL